MLHGEDPRSMLAVFQAEGPVPAKLIGSTEQGLAENPIGGGGNTKASSTAPFSGSDLSSFLAWLI